MSGGLVRGVVVVGGVDPGGGAGVGASAGVVRMLGVYSALVPAALVVEDSGGVRGVYPVGGRVLAEMLGCALRDVESGVVALSLHPRVEEASATRRVLGEHGGRYIVVYDPVWAASVGGALTLDEPRRVFDELARVADVVALNVDELRFLAGGFPASVGGAASAARGLLRRYGFAAVVVRGGHGLDCVDVLVEPDGYVVVGEPGCVEGGAHGTGCTHLGGLAAGLALGLGLEDAARLAWRVSRCAVGCGVPGAAARLAWPACAHGYWTRRVLEDVEAGLEALLGEWRLVEPHAPETGVNIVSAAPLGVEEWAGVAGRVRRGPRGPVAGPVALGASSHLYRLLRALHERGVTWLLGAVNIRFDERLVEAAEALGYTVALYDRRLEPPEVKAREGATIPWGVGVALESVEPRVPDAIGHRGDWGKEPMLVFVGRSALEAVEKMLRVLEAL